MNKWEKRLARKSPCKLCHFYREEYASYEEGGYLEELECIKRPNIARLWSFPFLKEQRCFVPNFWHSEFSKLIPNDIESLKEFSEAELKAIDKWHAHYKDRLLEDYYKGNACSG